MDACLVFMSSLAWCSSDIRVWGESTHLQYRQLYAVFYHDVVLCYTICLQSSNVGHNPPGTVCPLVQIGLVFGNKALIIRCESLHGVRQLRAADKLLWKRREWWLKTIRAQACNKSLLWWLCLLIVWNACYPSYWTHYKLRLWGLMCKSLPSMPLISLHQEP